MAKKGYCTVDEVEGITGDLTAAQQTRADSLIEAAETHIDRETNRAWLEGVQTQEAHLLPAAYLTLDYFPVASVTAVYGRLGLGEDETTLTVDVDYEVVDLASGQIRLVSPGSYDRIRVTYTPVDTVPADISQACAEIVAQWMQTSLRPGSYGLDSYSLPDLTVKFARSHMGTAVPPFVQSVIEHYRIPVHA